MAIYEIELDGGCNATVQLALFRRVLNVRELRRLLISGQLQCCLINPSLILDPFQVAVAVCKAVLSDKNQKMTTRTLFTEVLYNLSTSKNISQSLGKFGISDNSEDVLVIGIQKGGDKPLGNIVPLVVGELCTIDQLEEVRDIPSIKKEYGLRDEELKVSSLLDSVVSRIAAKEIVSLK